MKITENFDRWMFDYKEGNLTGAEEQAFENFLIQHPEFEVDADAWDQAFVNSPDIQYPHAKSLEKDRKFAGWYMWSAAAVLLLLVGSTTVYFINSDSADMTDADFSKSSSTLLNGDSYFNALSSNANSNVNGGDEALSRLLNGLGLSDPNASNSFGQNNSSNQVTYNNGYNNGNNLNNGNGSVNGNLPNNSNSIQVDPSGNNVTDLTENSKFVGSGSNNNLIEGENAKLNGNQNVAVYLGNPELKDLDFDVTKKSSTKYNSSSSVIKKLYHKVERMLSYPVGLTNLRDPDLLLPQSSLLAFNSAFTGGMLKPRFEMNYRNQWTGSSMNSQELNISYDTYVYGMRGGVGVLVNAQDYGMGKFGDYNMSLLYSPKIVLGKNAVLEPSVKFTMGTLAANGDKLTPDSAFEMDRGRTLSTIGDNEMTGISQVWYKDYGLGLMLNTKWFYAGFSADNLSQHYENVYGNDLSSPTKSPIKMSAVIGTDYLSRTETMTFSPFVAYKQFGNTPEFWGGMNYKLDWFVVGGAVSSNKEFTASVGMKFDTFKLVYTYDMTESVLMGDRIGSHNIGIRFNAKRKNQRLTH